MKLDFIFTAIFLTIIIDISCQSKSDFDMMVGNSVEKLYQNPDLGLKSAANIIVKDDQHFEKLIVKNIFTQAYYLKGNYGDAVKIALENLNSAGHEKKKISYSSILE